MIPGVSVVSIMPAPFSLCILDILLAISSAGAHDSLPCFRGPMGCDGNIVSSRMFAMTKFDICFLTEVKYGLLRWQNAT